MNYLYQYTYPDLLRTEDPVCDWQGILWAGKDRKGLNAPHPVDLFCAWQKDVQKAFELPGAVPKDVMQYFQASKHFSRPPKKGEIDTVVENLSRYKVGEVIIQNVNEKAAMMQYAFTWSYSQLSQFETCPYQWASERYYRTTVRKDTEATLWGSRVHKQHEDYVNSCGVSEKPEMGLLYSNALVAAKQKGLEVVCEMQLAIDRNLKPVAWSEGWGRGVVDVTIIQGKVARIWDWKTGRMKEDLTQLLIFCAFLAQHRQDIDEFQAEFVWLKDNVKKGMPKPVTRKELLPIWKDILTRVRRMETAVAEETFPKKQSGLCGKWCEVMDCPNNGRRK